MLKSKDPIGEALSPYEGLGVYHDLLITSPNGEASGGMLYMRKPLAIIVEDDYNLTFIYSNALQEAGYATEVVRDGHSALEALDNSTPDLVLLDLHLPSVSGRDIVRTIRSNERLANTRIIVSSGDSLMADQVKNDVDLLLLKPVSYIQLRDLSSRLNQYKTNVAAK